MTDSTPHSRRWRPALLMLLAWACMPGVRADQGSPLQKLDWRLLGPYRGGRSVAVAGVSQQPGTFYFGGADGGIWKTVDAGHHWLNVSDCCLDTGAIGALAVAPSDADVIYAGTGEAFPRGDALTGDGLWKSLDAGKTWVRAGLAETHVIAKIVVDPTDAQHLYVAALGHLFGPNPERGVYESTDGGANWKRILFVDDATGAADIVMDPRDPKLLYAAFWQVERLPWEFSDGGPGSGLYKSTDGGAHWTDLSHNPGMPAGPQGKIGVALAASAPGRVYALVEADSGGLFRSDDSGVTWRRLYHSGDLIQRAWYFSRVYVDPRDADRVYAPQSPAIMVSTDGGVSFKAQRAQGGDNHVLWIDPRDSQAMILGNDGGATVSLDGGHSWSSEDNQPTGQFYHVNVDDQFPFHLYGAQQDGSIVEIPSRTAGWEIDQQDWRTVAQWESGYSVPVPGKPWITYNSGGVPGVLERSDMRAGQHAFLSAWPDGDTGRGAADLKYRFQWTTPLVVSRYAPDTLYMGSQYVMRSRDGGRSWQSISPDLTRDDKSKQQPSGGPIHKDVTSVEYYDTVFALAESPLRASLLWAGTDDGKVWVTRDAGRRWSDVTPPELPAWSTVSIIEASRFRPGTAYVAAQRYRLDDFAPYVFSTADYGHHWRRLTDGLPADTTSFVVREDVKDPQLLFAGTLTGVYYSADAGDHWHPLQQNLPRTAVQDLAVQPEADALAAATHGRGFWVLDNLQPLRELTPAALAAPAYLFTPQTAWLTEGESDPDAAQYDAGQNPPNGATIFYELKDAPTPGTAVTLSFTDRHGRPIAAYTSLKPAAAGAAAGVTAQAGMNTFVWDLCYAAVEGDDEGPPVAPGWYRVTLTVGGTSLTRSLQVKKDPRIAASQADLEARVALLRGIQSQEAAIAAAGRRIDVLRTRLKAQPPGDARVQSRLDKLDRIERSLVTPPGNDDLQYLGRPAALQDRLDTLAFVVQGTFQRPTPGDYALWRYLLAEVGAQMQALDTLATE